MANRLLTMAEIAADLRALQLEHDISDKEMSDALRLVGASIGAPIDIGDLVDETQ
jgi:hypothetical protein